MSKQETTQAIWFKTARQVHQYLTCPIGDEYLWGDGETGLKEKGIEYSVSEKTIYNHIDDKDGKEKLKRNRKRCFPKRTVDIYAKTHLPNVVADADPAEVDEVEMTGSQASAARRVEADAHVKEITAKLQELKLKRELGQTVPTAAVERELGERAQGLKLNLSSFMRDASPEILSHVGGDIQAALEIIEIVEGNPEQAERLSGFIFSRRPLLLDTYRRRLVSALNTYARGEWFTEEMQEAWEKLIAAQNEEEAEVALGAVKLLGGDPSKLDAVLEQYEIKARVDR